MLFLKVYNPVIFFDHWSIHAVFQFFFLVCQAMTNPNTYGFDSAHHRCLNSQLSIVKYELLTYPLPLTPYYFL